MLSRILLLAGLCGLVSPAAARDLFVNNVTGSDRFGGFSETPTGESGPVASINRALELAEPGDRVFIAKTQTSYREQITIGGCRLHGTARKPLVITSDGAVLDGTVEAATGAWRHVAGDLFALRPRRLAYQRLFRDGEPLTRVRLASHVGADRALEPMQWDLTTSALILRTEEHRLPASYNLRHAGLQTGITLYNTRHVVIEGLVIQGFQQDGVNAHELVQDCVLRDLDCRANGRSGLSVGGVCRVAAEGCNFYDNGRAQVRTESLAKLDLESCDLDNQDEVPGYQQIGGELMIDGKPAE